MHQFLKFNFGIYLYMFRTVPLSIIRSFSLYTQQRYVSYRFADSLWAGSGRNWSSVLIQSYIWHIQLLCVQWKTPDDGQRKCPKHVELYSKIKFEKLVHLVAYIIRISAQICKARAYVSIYLFRTVPLSIIRSFSLYTQQCYISYRFFSTYFVIPCCQIAVCTVKNSRW